MGAPHGSKIKFLAAAMQVIRAKGYEAATIDDFCAAAALGKGSFFHHFGGKEELAVAAAGHFAAMADTAFGNAPYRALTDPLDRVLGYVDFRKAILVGALPDFTCLLGTMVQETYQTHPAIRIACERHICEHAAMLEADIAAAMRLHGPGASWSASSLAFHMQAVIQGAFVLAKARDNAKIAADCLDHLRRYIELLFDPCKPREQLP